MKIKERLFRTAAKAAAGCRIRHFRGHGVHSPFAYRIVRTIYMKRHTLPACGVVYHALLNAKCDRDGARIIQAIFNDTGCDSCMLNGHLITTANYGNQQCLVIHTNMQYAINDNNVYITCFAMPRRNKSYYQACMQAVKNHDGMSIDLRSVILLFHDDRLNKEHIKL